MAPKKGNRTLQSQKSKKEKKEEKKLQGLKLLIQ